MGGEGDVPSDDGHIFHELVVRGYDNVEGHLHARDDL